ncbi:MAG: glycosyltransferase family 2 protein [Alphaproteobacteria bacterium]|nr:glycosyltransferase family 2 protein [Alphaproteobacteria bacterium]
MRDLAVLNTFANAAGLKAEAVKLSILIPFYKDDPTELATALNPLIGARKDIEILLFDDGCPDPELNSRVKRTLKAMTAPARLITCEDNIGRSAGRNVLVSEAAGLWSLFLDADMMPSDDAFLSAYLERIEKDDFDAAFGGYETHTPDNADLALHAALSSTSDHSDAAKREAIGATAFCSSNLLVRTEMMRVIPFDTGFTGWGWEDIDWAVRAAKAHRLIHLDNPAQHGGLQAAEILLEKFRIGAENYARLLDRHPQLANLPGAKAARTLGAVPLQRHLRGLWAWLAKLEQAPMRLRTLAIKLWRASWTAEVLP